MSITEKLEELRKKANMNTPEKIEELKRKALAGDPDAQNSLGCAYHNANGVQRDYAKAKEWYEKSAEQGNCYAQSNLGILYRYGLGVEKSLTKAFEWYMKSAEQGYSNAQESVGIFYDYGYGVVKDYYKAVEWYTKAAEQGAKLAQNNLGSKYQNGQGVETNYHLAFYWYLKSAKQGNDYAQCNVAILYEEGKGVKTNYKEAAYWYEKSAKQGHERAITRLAKLRLKYDEHRDNRNLSSPFIYNNPFLILGVYSNSSARDIAANKSRLDAFLRIGKNVTFPVDKILGWTYESQFEIENIEEIQDDDSQSIDDVYHKIKGNEEKIEQLKKEPFYTSYDENSITEISKHQELIDSIEKIEAENLPLKGLYEVKSKKLYTVSRSQELVEKSLASINQPIDKLKYALFWYTNVKPFVGMLSSEGDEYVPYHNELFKNEDALSLIDQGVSFFHFGHDETAVRTIAKVIHNDSLRSDFVKAVCGDNFVISEEELAHLYIDTLLAEFPSVNWKDVFIDWTRKSAEEDRKYISNVLAKESIEKLSDAIKESSSISRSEGKKRYRQGYQLYAIAIEQLSLLKDLIGKDEIRYQQIADKTARELLNCAIDYYKECGESIYDSTRQSLNLCSFANSIAVGTTLKERTNECLAQIKSKYEKLPPESVYKLFTRIRNEISAFSLKPDLVTHSHELLTKTIPLLCEAKEILGVNDKSYLAISTEVVANALINIIAEVNSIFDDIDNLHKTSQYNPYSQSALREKYKNLVTILKYSWQLFINMDLLDKESDFASERYYPNRSTIKKHLENLHVDVNYMRPTMVFRTETEIYNTAKGRIGLSNYLKQFPNGKYSAQAKAKIADLNKADEEDWRSYSQKGDFEGYIKKYSIGGIHHKEAKVEIEKRNAIEEENYWMACSKNGDYALYIDRYKDGKYVSEAKDIIKKKEKNKCLVICLVSNSVLLCVLGALVGNQGILIALLISIIGDSIIFIIYNN